MGDSFQATIKNSASGKFVTANGTSLVAADKNNADTQKWNFTRLPNGSYTIVSQSENLAIDVEHTRLAEGTAVDMYNLTKLNAQTFFLIEKNGSVRYRDVMSFFEEDNYYYFWGEKMWGIVRPSLKFTLTPTEQTKNRMENLRNIYVEKLSSHTVGQSVDIGEEITFSIHIRNDRDTEAALRVEASVPQNTQYVSGGELEQDGILSWNVTVAPGKETTVEYKVRVNADPALYGTFISGEGSMVGGVNVRCRDMYVGRHLSAQESNNMKISLYNTADITERYMDMANVIYQRAGIELHLPKTEELLYSLFKLSDVSGKHYVLNDDSPYIAMLVPTMYGGYYCCEEYTKDRTADIYSCKLYTGDILVAREKDKLYAYIYVEDNRVFSLKTGNMIYASEARDQLLTLIGRDVFAVLRPALEE